MRIKNTHTRIKVLFELVCFYRTCVFQHAYFYARQRTTYKHGMRIFQAFIKKNFLRCGVKRLFGVVVMLLAFETLIWIRSSSFFIARFSVRVAGAVAQD